MAKNDRKSNSAGGYVAESAVSAFGATGAGTAADPFAGLSDEQVSAVQAHIASLLATERANLDQILEAEITASNLSAERPPVSVEEFSNRTLPAANDEPDVAAAKRETLMTLIGSMYEGASAFIVAIESHGRVAAQAADHGSHTAFSRLATVFGEFRNGLATILNAPNV